jgi:tetratricopeptide (TPR) repeat protein
MLRGIAMHQLNRGQVAMRCFERAAAKDPTSAEPHLLIASLHLDDDNIQAARTAIERARGLDPQAVEEGNWLEQIEQHQQRLAGADVENRSIR